MWEVMRACNSLGWPSGRGFICSVKWSEFNTQFRKKSVLSENSVSKTVFQEERELLSTQKNICRHGGSLNTYVYEYIFFLHAHTYICKFFRKLSKISRVGLLGCWALVG